MSIEVWSEGVAYADLHNDEGLLDVRALSGGRSASNVLATARTRVANHTLPVQGATHRYNVPPAEAEAAVAASVASGAEALERADALRARLYSPAEAVGALVIAA